MMDLPVVCIHDSFRTVCSFTHSFLMHKVKVTIVDSHFLSQVTDYCYYIKLY